MSYRNFREEVEDMPHAGYINDGYVWRIEAAEIAARADARIAELEHDAERYHWLRRKVYVVGLHHLHDNDCGQFEFANLPRISGPMAGVGNAADALDVVIDAALLEINL